MPADVERAAALLAGGGLVAFPTETVYGLGADADNPAAVAAIFAAKGRPVAHPLIVHIADRVALAAWATPNVAAMRLAEAFWPGPLTLILPRTARAIDAVTGAQATVGLRCPAHPLALELLLAFGRLRADPTVGIAAPSANRFGRISPTTAAHVRADLGEKPAGAVDLIVDGGATPIGIESTIVDCSAAAIRVLRPGAITRAQIEQALGAPLSAATVTAPLSPAPRVSGQMASHYAPRTPLELVAPGDLSSRINALRSQALALLAPAAALLDPPAHIVMRLVAPADASAYAHRLYADLRRLDDSGAQRILVVAPPAGPAWEAIADRLRRAAHAADGRADHGT